MESFEQFISEQLSAIEGAGLRRRMEVFSPLSSTGFGTESGEVIPFCSNDYLGLSRHPAVCRALGGQDAKGYIEAGAGAARLVSGTRDVHRNLERALAAFKGAEDAITFTSGYATALGVLPALVGAGDVVILDRLSHACLVDGAWLSGAKIRVFRHNDVSDLERILRWADDRRAKGKSGEASRILVVTESVFSMDGDRAPLRDMVEVTSRWGAWMMVDEAHATGIAGSRRRGVIEELGLEGHVQVAMGTLGKAVGVAGGFVAGSKDLISFLMHRARSFMFSTAMPPAVAEAGAVAVGLVAGFEGAARVAALRRNLGHLKDRLTSVGWSLPAETSPILPLSVGDEADAMRLAAALREEGYLVPAIRFPTVPRGSARLRVTVSAEHESSAIDGFAEALARALTRTSLKPK